jgi:hypothetical protein
MVRSSCAVSNSKPIKIRPNVTIDALDAMVAAGGGGIKQVSLIGGGGVHAFSEKMLVGRIYYGIVG